MRSFGMQGQISNCIGMSLHCHGSLLTPHIPGSDRIVNPSRVHRVPIRSIRHSRALKLMLQNSHITLDPRIPQTHCRIITGTRHQLRMHPRRIRRIDYTLMTHKPFHSIPRIGIPPTQMHIRRGCHDPIAIATPSNVKDCILMSRQLIVIFAADAGCSGGVPQ